MAANRIRSMFPTPARKGETFELRNGLNSQYSHERFGSSTALKRCKLPRGLPRVSGILQVLWDFCKASRALGFAGFVKLGKFSADLETERKLSVPPSLP